MKFFRLDLLTLLISLFILNSCKNPESIGLDVDETDQLSGTLVVDSNVVLNTVEEEDVRVSDLGRTPLALFNDPEIGLTESNIVTNINLPGLTKYTAPEGTITIDSAILLLKYSPGGFYGDSLNTIYKVNVFKLLEKPNASAVYSKAKKWTFNDGLVLGTKTFLAKPHDTTKIVAIVKGKPDTLTRVLPQVRVPINTDYVRDMLFNITSHTSSNEAFQNYEKGFYITLDKTNTLGIGGILGFRVPDTLAVYIKVNNGGTIDTSIVSMPITRHIAEITHTYSADVEAALADNSGSDAKAYIKGMGGLRVKVDFPGLKDLPKNIIINRAELVLVPKPGITSSYAPLPRLMMYKLDLAKQRTYIEDSVDGLTGYSGLFGGFYGVPISNEYRFLITSYIQNLVSGKTTDYGTYIGAASEAVSATGIDITPTAYPIARTVLVGKNSPYRVKLNIIYTKLK